MKRLLAVAVVVLASLVPLASAGADTSTYRWPDGSVIRIVDTSPDGSMRLLLAHGGWLWNQVAADVRFGDVTWMPGADCRAPAFGEVRACWTKPGAGSQEAGYGTPVVRGSTIIGGRIEIVTGTGRSPGQPGDMTPWPTWMPALVAHELGHTLGLNHSARSTAIMQPNIASDGSPTTPDGGDSADLVAMYGPGPGDGSPDPVLSYLMTFMPLMHLIP